MEWDDQDFKEWEYKDETSGTSKLQQRCSLVEVDTLARSRGRKKVHSWRLGSFWPHSWSLEAPCKWAAGWQPEFRARLKARFLGSFQRALESLPGYGFGPADFLQVGGESLEAVAYPFPSPLHNHSQKLPLEAWSNTINMSCQPLFWRDWTSSRFSSMWPESKKNIH